MDSKRVYLRAFEPSDYKVSIKWRQDREIWEMLGGTMYYVSEAYEKKWVEDAIFNAQDVRLAVCLKDNNRYIGNIYMTNIDQVKQSCSSHILIGERDCWGKGLACEAIAQACEYMFKERNIHRIQALILEKNVQSLRMYQKCGFKIDGILRDSIFKDGQFQNQYIVSLLSTEI